MSADREVPSGPNPQLDERVTAYLEDKPPGKATVTSLELFNQLELTSRQACDALARLSNREDSPVGERTEVGKARWELRS